VLLNFPFDKHCRFYDTEYMQRKTILLLGILAGITIVVLYSAFHSGMPSSSKGIQVSSVISLIPKTAVISFNPPSVQAKTSSAQTTSIVVNTGKSDIMGVQIVLAYNPKLITSLQINPSENNLFGAKTNYSVLQNTVNATLGKASFIIAIPVQGKHQHGAGPIATITFTPVSSSSVSSTTLSFTADTKVEKIGEEQSVLQSTNSFMIYCSSP